MLTDDVKLISVDDHLVEPPNLWQDRLPARHREMGPRVVETETGAQLWSYEGEVVPSSGLGHSAGREKSKRFEQPQRFDEMRPGYYDPVARLADMDLDGVHMQLCFPNWARYAGTRFHFGTDKELGRLCVEAYNDFLVNEWTAAAPDRYIPMILLPLWDIEGCVAEVLRWGDQAKAVAFPTNTAALGLPSFHTSHWDPLFSAVEELDLPLCSHFGTSGFAPPIGEEAGTAVLTACMGVGMAFDMADLVLSRTFHHHPNLKVVYSESGIGWWPSSLQRIDQVWENFRFVPDEKHTINPDVRPSELIKKHMWACFIDDPLGLELRHKIGVDNLLWESDYPHQDSLWPESRSNAAKVMADIPDDEVRLIVQDNARALFKLDL